MDGLPKRVRKRLLDHPSAREDLAADSDFYEQREQGAGTYFEQ